MEHRQKTALVTGSTSGIGLGIARALAATGCHVMLNGLGDPDHIEAIRAAIEKEYSVRCEYHGANLACPQEIKQLFAQANKIFEGIDILVNNAGIQHVAPIESFPAEKWDAILAINLSSAFHTIKHAVPWMKQQAWGRIVNVASAHALVASPFKSAYVAAKHGLAGLTKSVALEVAECGITVNALCPGYVLTPLVEGQIADTAKARHLTEEEVVKNVLLQAQATKAFVSIEQLAATVTFLCTEHAANITGVALPVDGGWTAQ